MKPLHFFAHFPPGTAGVPPLLIKYVCMPFPPECRPPSPRSARPSVLRIGLLVVFGISPFAKVASVLANHSGLVPAKIFALTAMLTVVVPIVCVLAPSPPAVERSMSAALTGLIVGLDWDHLIGRGHDARD